MLTDKEKHEIWIRNQLCYMCDPRYAAPTSDPHHVGDGVNSRRSLPDCVPLCRGHHRLITDQPYLEKLLDLRSVAKHYLKLHKFESTLDDQ